MNTVADAKYIEHISRDIYDISKAVSSLSGELEQVGARLRAQTVFREQLRALDGERDSLEEEQYKLRVLSQALSNIGMAYSRTEREIEDRFDPPPLIAKELYTDRIDLRPLRVRLSNLLYGGES